MPKRVDANQKMLTEQLRARGCSVQPIHVVGKGCPDLLVGYLGRNYLFEIKDPDQPFSRRQLTDDEKNWHNRWKGQVNTVHSIEEILVILNLIHWERKKEQQNGQEKEGISSDAEKKEGCLQTHRR